MASDTLRAQLIAGVISVRLESSAPGGSGRHPCCTWAVLADLASGVELGARRRFELRRLADLSEIYLRLFLPPEPWQLDQVTGDGELVWTSDPPRSPMCWSPPARRGGVLPVLAQRLSEPARRRHPCCASGETGGTAKLAAAYLPVRAAGSAVRLGAVVWPWPHRPDRSGDCRHRRCVMTYDPCAPEGRGLRTRAAGGDAWNPPDECCQGNRMTTSSVIRRRCVELGRFGQRARRLPHERSRSKAPSR
jgi:hypothetical protein